jgi:hypothetical protein
MVLTPGARSTFSRGYIYNLVTADADSVQQMCNQVFTLVSSPIRICVAMVLLYVQLGVSAFAALVLLICVIPVQVRCTVNLCTCLSALFLRMAYARHVHLQLRLMNNCLCGGEIVWPSLAQLYMSQP